MLAQIAVLIALGLPQDAGTASTAAELTSEEIAQVLAEAEATLESATAAQEAGDVAKARAEADRVIELIAPLPLGEEHDEAADILWRVGDVAYDTGNFPGAREAWSLVVHHRERTLPADHPDLLTARIDLANTMYSMGDLSGARALEEAVLEASERTLPDDHPDLLAARLNLAITMSALGDLAGARALEESVLEAYERTLPDDHSDLLLARGNLAVTMKQMGDLPGARALEEAVLEAYERTLPDDHPDLLAARLNLAGTMSDMGDLPGARALLEAVLEAYEHTLPDDHPHLLAAQLNLAGTMKQMGDLSGARALEEAVLEARERTLPDDHPDLLRVRSNLAVTMSALGDLAGARALEEAVLKAYERALPDDHPDLLRARYNLAVTMKQMGDLSGARALEEAVLEARERTLPDDHPDLLRVRGNLAVTMREMGDLSGARALFEAVLEARERMLPADHPELLTVRGNLAATMSELGDLSGARALFEAVLEACERTLPADHPDLLRARGNLAVTMDQLGDLAGARALFEAVLEARERTLPADHPDLLNARGNLAATMSELGDMAGARALQESVLEAYERTPPADHSDLPLARRNLAVMMREMGDLPGARALQEAVLEAYERTLPTDHPDLLAARLNLAVTMREMGDLPGARALGLDLARGMLRRLEIVSVLSPREASEAVGAEAHRHSIVRFLTGPFGTEGVAAMRFDLAETLRAVATVSGASADQDDPRRLEISKLRAGLNDLVSGGPGEGQSTEEFAAEVSRLTLERDRLERAIRGDLAERGIVAGATRASEVASALPEGAAAVGFLRYWKWALDQESSQIRFVGDVLAAHVLLADGSLSEVELGPADELEELARVWRSSLGQPISKVSRGAYGERGQRGVAVNASRDGVEPEAEVVAGAELRARILDPILERLGEEVTTLHVCLDDFLHLLPIDALPLGNESDGRVRERYRIVNEVSFARLMADRPQPTGDPELLAIGAVKFDAGDTEGPRDREAETFAVLPETRAEAEHVGDVFEQSFEENASLLMEERATKEALHESAPGVRYLHVATHGWFAPETIPSTLDAREDDDALWSRMGAQEAVTGLAPMTLCGLAFAGANQGRDSLGRVPGIMTAEELAGIDLSNCELAVLSACETNVGIRRAGQGIQSLQSALHAAGARTTITSLWKVDDAATRRLFEIFYTKLWVEQVGKADALWQAKMALKEEGHPTRDWAGWVLTGDPD